MPSGRVANRQRTNTNSFRKRVATWLGRVYERIRARGWIWLLLLIAGIFEDRFFGWLNTWIDASLVPVPIWSKLRPIVQGPIGVSGAITGALLFGILLHAYVDSVREGRRRQAWARFGPSDTAQLRSLVRDIPQAQLDVLATFDKNNSAVLPDYKETTRSLRENGVIHPAYGIDAHQTKYVLEERLTGYVRRRLHYVERAKRRWSHLLHKQIRQEERARGPVRAALGQLLDIAEFDENNEARIREALETHRRALEKAPLPQEEVRRCLLWNSQLGQQVGKQWLVNVPAFRALQLWQYDWNEELEGIFPADDPDEFDLEEMFWNGASEAELRRRWAGSLRGFIEDFPGMDAIVGLRGSDAKAQEE